MSFGASRRLFTGLLVLWLSAGTAPAQSVVPAAPGAGSQSESAADHPTPPPTSPTIDFYFPEGELDFRLHRLVNNAFFEGRVQYDFPDGDIGAFLRYRFYGRQRIYQLSLFDTIEGESVDRGVDFERIRGGQILVQWPFNYHHRAFLLAELDRISSNKEEFRFSAARTNTFVRFGYQLGTPDDERSNRIVGDERAQLRSLFSAYRRIGPGDFGLTGAVSYSADYLGSDFAYLKLELSGLKRFRVTRRTFAIGRIQAGTFPHARIDRPELPSEDQFAVPRNELFRLHGRDNLKGLRTERRGTDRVILSGEYFVPWFLDGDRRALGLRWNSWYWVGYAGTGNLGFNQDIFREFEDYVVDLGVGFESSFRLREFTFFLSGIVARTFDPEGDPKVSFSIKSYH